MEKRSFGIFATAAALLASSGTAVAGDWTANVSAASNYIWRGLTQTENSAAVSGGIDFAADNGFYVGTWASNVSYVPADPFSFEHDLYAGFRGGETATWDVGFLYYNYDSAANYDFSEVYVALGFKGATLKYSTLVQSNRDEALDQGLPGLTNDLDYGFGQASYLALDYSYTLPKEVTLGFHVGTHEGDFARSFNGFLQGSYLDYSVSLSKGGFKFMISDTDLSDDDQPGFILQNNNGEPKFTVSYSVAIDL